MGDGPAWSRNHGKTGHAESHGGQADGCARCAGWHRQAGGHGHGGQGDGQVPDRHPPATVHMRFGVCLFCVGKEVTRQLEVMVVVSK